MSENVSNLGKVCRLQKYKDGIIIKCYYGVKIPSYYCDVIKSIQNNTKSKLHKFYLFSTYLYPVLCTSPPRALLLSHLYIPLQTRNS